MKKKSWSWSSSGLEVGRAPLVDLVGGGGDHRAGRLAEDLGEADNRRDPGLDQVLEGLAGADRRQLVGVADEDDVGRLGQAAEQHLDQPQVEHRGLVDDHQVGRQRMARLEARLAPGHPLEHAVDRLRLVAGRLLEAAGGATGRRAEGDPQAGAFGLLDDRPGAGGLADAGPAGEDRDPRAEGAAHRRPLLVGQFGVLLISGAGSRRGRGRGGAGPRRGLPASVPPRARWRGSARGRRGPSLRSARAPRSAPRDRGRGRAASPCAGSARPAAGRCCPAARPPPSA